LTCKPATLPATASDIIGRDLHTGAWWVGVSDGHGHFTTTLWDTWSPAVDWVDVQVGDFNGDGKVDIAGRVQENGQWWVGLSTGRSFQTALWGGWSPAVSWEDVRVGDLTGSGKANLIGRTPGGEWWAALSHGTTFTNTLWTTWAPDAPTLTWVDVQLADVNGDGKADLVSRCTGRTLAGAAGALRQAGARAVHAICTHAVMAPGAAERLVAAQFGKVLTTDSIPVTADPWLEVVPITPLLDRTARCLSGESE
jgi:hypothetical protein